MLASLLALASPSVGIGSVLLIAFGDPQDQSLANDAALIDQAFARRGLPESAVTLWHADPKDQGFSNQMERYLERIPTGGPVMIFITGPGDLDRSTLAPSPVSGITWQEILQPLEQRKNVRFEVVADTGFTNLLYGRVPKNVSFLGVAGTWRDVTQKRNTGMMIHSGTPVQAGVMSYLLARELPYATTIGDLAARVSRYKESGSMGAIWFNAPVCQVLGRSDEPLPGQPLKT